MVDMNSNSQASELDVEMFVNAIADMVVQDEDNNFVEKVGEYIVDICYLACTRKVKLGECDHGGLDVIGVVG